MKIDNIEIPSHCKIIAEIGINHNGDIKLAKQLVDLAKRNFKKTSIFKPSASRKESKESFIICKFLRDEVKK